MNEVLKNKYPYLSNFFSEIFKSTGSSIANSLIFYGSDVLAQYYFAMSLAKQLNCLHNGDEDCNCVNCNWIRANNHPAVITISKVDNKTDDSKTVISKQQIDLIKDSLVNSSSYHRVFIFCDAEYKKLSQQEIETKEEFSKIQIELPTSGDDSLSWYPKGLTKNCFQDVAANALLKSIEEPPVGVTFIFLTEDKNDLISTIISRSQAFFIPNFVKETYNTSFLDDILSDYPSLEISNAIKLAKILQEYQAKNDLSSTNVLDCLQYYLKQILFVNKDNKPIFYKVLSDIQKVQESKKMIKAHVKDAVVFEDLAFSLCK